MRNTPQKSLGGKPQRPGRSQLLSSADLNFTITRGHRCTVAGPARVRWLVVATPLTGTFQARGTLTNAVGSVGNSLGNLIGGSVGQQVQSLAGKTISISMPTSSGTA